MSVKNFKFVSPGVFINEIDNSFIPKQSDAIGPVVIGRTSRGPALRPIKIESYSDFLEVFGDTVPGGGSPDSDVYRYGNDKSAMYGTYAAKAFLRSNVAPLTYIRLLGEQSANTIISFAREPCFSRLSLRMVIVENLVISPLIISLIEGINFIFAKSTRKICPFFFV